MEEKKPIKISLSTFFLIISIIIIVVMAYFIFKIYNQKMEETNKTVNLQAQVNDLQNKINTITETINPNNSTENNNVETNTNNIVSFTDSQVKTTLANYLELLSSANCGDPLDTLNKKGKINYDPLKNSISNDGKVTTTLKFSDYKKAMLNYVTEAEFERNWTSKIYLEEDSNGYLTTTQGGGGYRTYTINSITKVNDSTYSAKTISIVEGDNSTKENNTFTFTIKNSNGNCVIDSIKE